MFLKRTSVILTFDFWMFPKYDSRISPSQNRAFILKNKEFATIFLKTLLNNFKFMSKFYYIYVLRSKIDNGFYVGYTENLKLRFEQHSKGQVISTRDRRPLEIIYSEMCLSKKDALHREKYLKTHHGKLFLRNRLKSYLTG